MEVGLGGMLIVAAIGVVLVLAVVAINIIRRFF